MESLLHVFIIGHDFFILIGLDSLRIFDGTLKKIPERYAIQNS